MDHNVKTAMFLVAGIGLSAIAAAAHFATLPKPITEFALVGQPFFPDFTDPGAVQALQVKAANPNTGKVFEFKVEFRDGLWRIPSHYDYPAEASKRVGETASALMGLARESLVARRDAQYEQYGVHDPEATGVSDPASLGKRITLFDAQGKVVADFIIGKKSETRKESRDPRDKQIEEAQDYYYVRVPAEREAYLARLTLDLSTRFADWIDPDVLRLTGGDLARLVIDRQRIEEREVETPLGIAVGLQALPGETTVLNRKERFDPWTMEGLNEETEEIDTISVGNVVSLLDNLKISGVRPKYTYNGKQLLNPDLTLNRIPELEADRRELQAAVEECQTDLEKKGFFIGQNEQTGGIELLAKQGKLIAGTRDGVAYNLYFGDIVIGDEVAIEIGSPVTSDQQEPTTPPDAARQPSDAAPGAEKPADGGAEEAEQKTAGEQPADGDAPKKEEEKPNGKNRYLMVSVVFDPALLGEEPVKPTEPGRPAEPEGYAEWKKKQEETAKAEEDKKTDGAQDPAAPEEPQPPADDAPPKPPPHVEDEADKVFRDYEEARRVYEEAQRDYEFKLTQYESDAKAFKERRERGEKQVAELNARFGEWYYVVSADLLESLSLDRSKLVRAKTPVGGEEPASDLPPRPDISFEESAASDSHNGDAPHVEPSESPELPDPNPLREPKTPDGKTDDDQSGGERK